jgi:dienelactone hydrolase
MITLSWVTLAYSCGMFAVVGFCVGGVLAMLALRARG